jgi:hypothetical protein
MIATAIGKPTANVLTNVRANSESKFGSGRVCSNDMRAGSILANRKGTSEKFSDVRAKGCPQPARRLRLKG